MSAKQQPILFLHIGWAREYRGDPDDPPRGKFGFILKNDGAAGELVNFKPVGRYCYGYAPRASIRLTRLGGRADDDHVDGVLVVFTATDPDGSGRYVVGWYRNARVYAKRQVTAQARSGERPDFIVRAAKADTHLVPVSERTFYIPSLEQGWPGTASAFYPCDHLSPKQLNTLLAYVDGKASWGYFDIEDEPPIAGGRGKSQDASIKAETEVAAVATVMAHYRKIGYRVRSVETDNLGWDLEARLGPRTLLIEVKGRLADGAVELTPREYAAMIDRRRRLTYRLAIVHDARARNPRLTIFGFDLDRNSWIGGGGEVLKITPRTGGSMSF